MGKEHLITKKWQYAAVYNEGSTWVNSLLVMKAVPNGLLQHRYGFSVSRRVGNAVVRNRVRRLLREIMRMNSIKPGWDIIFIGRSAAARANYAVMQGAVVDLLSRARLLAKAHEEVSLSLN